MRISVSSWATTDEDVERSLEAMIKAAAKVRAKINLQLIHSPYAE
jgi:hypothetical protein